MLYIIGIYFENRRKQKVAKNDFETCSCYAVTVGNKTCSDSASETGGKCKMRLAVCQMNIIWENKKENYKKAEQFCKKAKELGADLICFPEMSFTGFSMNTQKTAEKDNETVNLMKEYAKKYHLALGFGWTKKTEGKAENHYTVIDGEKICGDYIKIHPFSYSGEDQYFQGGTKPCIIEVKGLKIGLTVCYDLRFPELYQYLSEKAELILVPANWPKSRSMHWKILLQARAIENQSYIAGINCYGDIGQLYYSGDSCVFHPNGECICGYLDKEELQICDIENDVKKYRNGFPVKQDRKPDLYKEFYKTSDNQNREFL